MSKDNHYKQTSIQPIDIIDDYNLKFSLGNSIKYILRSDFKNQKNEDLRKAITYIAFELKKSTDKQYKKLAKQILKLTN